MDEYGFSIISAWRNDNYGWIKDDNINGCNEKNIRYKERFISYWYDYYKTYPWMRKIYEMSLW
jgi:hypothetical protein